MIGVAQVIVCANQLYGDMGIFYLEPMYTLAISFAMAIRLPPIAGAWGHAPSSVQVAREVAPAGDLSS
jgi:hypothetical protein